MLKNLPSGDYLPYNLRASESFILIDLEDRFGFIYYAYFMTLTEIVARKKVHFEEHDGERQKFVYITFGELERRWRKNKKEVVEILSNLDEAGLFYAVDKDYEKGWKIKTNVEFFELLGFSNEIYENPFRHYK